MFSIRRMLPADKSALLDIASRIWEGTDYLPAVFDEWVADTRGEFAAVLLGGRLAGCGKLTFLTDTDAWLEGLRKDPRVSEHGLGGAAVEHFLRLLAARPGLTSIRFSTYVNNRASIAINERIGFRVRTTLSVKAWQGSRIEMAGAGTREHATRSVVQANVVTIRDPAVIAGFLERSHYFEGTQGLLVEGWRAFPFTVARFLERYAATGCCRGVFGGGALAGMTTRVITSRPGRRAAKIVFLDASDDEIARALLDDVFRSLTETSNRDDGGGEICEVEWMVPPGEQYRAWCSSRALASWEQEQDFLVYELPLDELGSYAAAASASPHPVDTALRGPSEPQDRGQFPE
jgi:hypothetical protein